jgi:iron complex outermembrane recepter protein
MKEKISFLIKTFTFIFFLIVLFAFSPLPSLAQNSIVTIKVINKQSLPVVAATVKVIPVHDSLLEIVKVTDSLGAAIFDLLPESRYRVMITSVSYLPAQKGIIIKNAPATFSIMLESGVKTLAAVVIAPAKPLMRQEDDKTIVDPENLAASSTSGYEVLEKTPGLFVDQDGNVYLNSTTPASVYINGREQKMSVADVASLLKSLPPNSIASIEILRTPSAKYDASGSGGIVNIVLKKGIKLGLTGSVNAGMTQGRYGTQFSGINLNDNDGPFSGYLNVQYTHKNTYDEVKTDRLFAPDSILRQDAFTTYPGNNYYLGYGMSYELSKKWEVGYDGRITFSDSYNSSVNGSEISGVNAQAVSVNNISDVSNRNHTFFLSQGISSKFKIDSSGSEWNNDVSYNYSPNNTGQQFLTSFSSPFIGSASGDGNLQTHLSFFSAQSNLVWKLPKKLTIETGLKTTITRFRNNTAYFNGAGAERTKDLVRSSLYDYDESINAAYIQASKVIFGVTLKAGTRLENTSMKGKQLFPGDTSFTINRTDLFPYLYLSHSLLRIMGYDLKGYLVYRRTISRPGYQLLNPSPRYVDPYLFETGNPTLRPQFTQNYEANISVDDRPIFAIGINDTKDIFTNVVYQADTSSRVAYRTYDNLGTNKETYFRILGAIPPGRKYFIVGGFQYNHNLYEGLYEGKPLLFDKGSWSIFTYQTLKLSPTSQLTLNGFARFNGQQQFYELTPFGALNLSINQQFIKKKLIITLSANDLFFTNNNNFTLKEGIVSASGFRKSDTRRFGINARYNFGIRKKEDRNFLNVDSPEKL